ncbi:hypothetical protein DN402_22420 [Streptomyces sp. SW4]|nr:hypothetical protein DN402_22420 [Streptomyces sp. SW4]
MGSFRTLRWRKSSYSGPDDGNECVEIANTRTHVAVRDSKAPPGPPSPFPPPLSRPSSTPSSGPTAPRGPGRRTGLRVSAPPDGLPVYRVLTGPDDASFCRRVSEALELGYELHEGPAVTFDGERVVVAQAVVWPKRS